MTQQGSTTARPFPLEMRRLGTGRTLAVSPSGRSYDIALGVDDLESLLNRVDAFGEVRGQDYDRAGAVEPTALDAGSAEIIRTLIVDGALASRTRNTAQTERQWARFDDLPAGRSFSTVRLLGDPELSGAIASVAPPSMQSRLMTGGDVTEGDLLIALSSACDAEFLLGVGELARTVGVPWLPLWFQQGHAYIGPGIVPGVTEDMVDVLGRLLGAADRPDVHVAFWHEGPRGRAFLPPKHELAWIAGFLLAQVERWIVGAPNVLVGHVVEADPVAFTLTPHPVLPLPDRTPADYPFRGARSLVDSATGVITGFRDIAHHPSVPPRLCTVQSDVADMRRLHPWANNTVCQGSAFDDRLGARNAALGEAVERYCGNWVRKDILRRASFNALDRGPENAVSPSDLCLYSETQYCTAGFPFVPFDHDLPVHWVEGFSLTRAEPIWVPASIVYVNWYTDQFASEPPTNYLYYPGIAAGTDLESAIVSGLEEAVERDATMVWWMNSAHLPTVQLTADLEALWRGCPSQRPSIIHLDNEFDLPVIAGVLDSPEERLFNIGFAVRPDPCEAARKAWTEALTLQEGSRDMRLEDGNYWGAVRSGQLNGQAMKPVRSDDCYLDSYRPDYRDVSDLMCQQQVFLDPRARELVRTWTDTPTTRTFADLPRLSDRTLATYRQRIESRGYEIVYVDVTTPDVAAAGLRVVRVVVPGLVPNAPAAFPFLGRRRIQDEAVRRGWRSTPLLEADLNYAPLPHA